MDPIKIYDLNKDFDSAREYAENFLKENDTPDVVMDETMLILEALLFKIFEKDEDYVHSNKSTGYVNLKGVKRIGVTALKLSFEGKRFASEDEESSLASETPEERILRAYAERIDYSFHTGLNRISIVTQRNVFRRSRLTLIAMILAIITYIFMTGSTDAESRKWLLDNIVAPTEILLGNAVLMVGAPVTFLSLLKNLTETYIVSERNRGLTRLRRSIVGSSIVCSILGLFVATGIIIYGRRLNAIPDHMAEVSVRLTIKEFITTLMPSDIFTPFQVISPFPLIFLAGLVIYSFVSVGKYFDKLKDAIDAAYALMSRMLGLVLYTIPFFAFFAMIDILLRYGYYALSLLITIMTGLAISLILPLAYYVLRIKVSGFHLKPFVEKLIPLLKENAKMTSAIDAAPFNIRYCAKNYRIDRGWLEQAIPILAHINRDGNCFLVTAMALVISLMGNNSLSLFNLVVITLLVFFLSYGSPNQPGSMLIGVTIILIYANAFENLALAILAEVILGNTVSMINIIGDIVTIVVDGSPGHESKA